MKATKRAGLRARMTETPTPLADRLAELQEATDEARSKRTAARDRREKERYRQAREVTADLLAFRDDIAHKKPTATPPDERDDRQRELTEAFCADLIERGLILKAVGNGGAVEIIDPSIDGDLEAAEREWLTAQRERDSFASENAEGIAAEVKAQEAATIRTALEGDDPDAIREALNGKTAALTSDELTTPRERVTTAA